MSKADVIAERAQPAIREQGTADILIAVPTFNNEGTIGSVLTAARTAMLQFPERKVVIVQADGGSTDGTMERAKDKLQGETCFAQVSYPIYPVHRLEVSHHSVPGKDSAYRTIFFLAEELNANACCIVGGDAAVTPDWIASLVQPIVETGFDLAAPFYQRHKYDGLLVNGIIYPLVRTLFGKRLRQPIGNDFAYSRSLIRHCLSLDTWGDDVARRDIDLWINVQAMQYEMKLCQVYLGARQRTLKEGGGDVTSILANLAGAIFLEMEPTAGLWQRVRGSSGIPVLGLRFDPENGAQPNVKPMMDAFRIGYANLQDIWGLVLPPATLLELKRLSRQTEEKFHFAGELWARTVYDFAVAHRLRMIGRDHLLRALTPLYMGWVASFILSIKDADDTQVENKVEQLCIAYESQKPYLISRWRWPDRFMP